MRNNNKITFRKIQPVSVVVKSNNNQRLLWADVIRIIAIYLVVQAHTLTTLPTSSFFLYSIFFVMDSVTRTCVPLFVMLSGALILGKHEALKPFFQKRVMKVIIPWIAWSIIYMWYKITFYPHHIAIFHEFFVEYRKFWAIQYLHYFYHIFIAGLWFLPLIASLYLLTPALRIFIRKVSRPILLVSLGLWFIYICLIPYVLYGQVFFTFELTFRTILQYVGYYVLGYVLISKPLPKFILWSLPLFFIIGAFPQLLSLLSINKHYIKYFSLGYLGPGSIVCSIAFFYFLYLLSNRYEHTINPTVRKFISLVSSTSLGVYIVHWIVIDQLANIIAKWLHFFNADYFMTLIIFIISTCFVLLLKRIPLIKRIVP